MRKALTSNGWGFLVYPKMLWAIVIQSQIFQTCDDYEHQNYFRLIIQLLNQATKHANTRLNQVIRKVVVWIM